MKPIVWIACLGQCFWTTLLAQTRLFPIGIEPASEADHYRILYDLVREDGTATTITARLSLDGGDSYRDMYFVEGDVGPGVLPGTSKEIIWNAAYALPQASYEEVMILLRADDGTGLDIVPASLQSIAIEFTTDEATFPSDVGTREETFEFINAFTLYEKRSSKTAVISYSNYNANSGSYSLTFNTSRLGAFLHTFSGRTSGYSKGQFKVLSKVLGNEAHFILEDLDLTKEIWDQLDPDGDGWGHMEQYGWFQVVTAGWIFDPEHGWQYLIGEDTNSMWLYDLAMARWFWISLPVYPAVYMYGRAESWVLYLMGGTAGDRWFYHYSLGRWFEEEDPLDDTPDPDELAGSSLIPAGTFTMGSPGEETYDYTERPLHMVTLSRSFDMKKTEVSWQEWNAVRDWALAHGYPDLPTGTNGHNGDDSGQHPVTSVSWYDVVKWLNAKTEMEAAEDIAERVPCFTVEGLPYREGNLVPDCDFTADGYRLPTEAEWEYACRAGSNTAYYSGNLEADLLITAWYAANASYQSHPVGHKQPNAWELYDMHGNVSEWCWDIYGYYEEGKVTDPTGPEEGYQRVIRGGSFYDSADKCRSGSRQVYYTDTQNLTNLGFRWARTAEDK